MLSLHRHLHFKYKITMIDSFMSLEPMLQGYWVLAILSSLVFAVQAIATFSGFGIDADTDLGGDADFDSDGFHIISVKTIVCFILGFGWTGVLFWNSIESKILLTVLAFVVGVCFMLIIALMLRWVLKLDRDNTFHTSQAIGSVAEVYLRIPASRKETGKITVSHNGSTHELEALTDEKEDIPTGGKDEILEVVKS